MFTSWRNKYLKFFLYFRSHSPQSPRHKNKPPPTAEDVAKSSQSLDVHVKDITNALKHFRDVILKKKLEVLPGNGTVILETTASMFSGKFKFIYIIYQKNLNIIVYLLHNYSYPSLYAEW